MMRIKSIKHLTIDNMKERLKNVQIAKKQALQKLDIRSEKVQRLMSKETVSAKSLTSTQNSIFQ